MGALLTNHTKRGVRWALVAHTVAMFFFLMVAIAMGFNLQSISFIDNREFNDPTSPGPLGYKSHVHSITRSIPNCTFQLNQWLADGLLASSVSNLSPGCLPHSTSLALSLLCYLFYELLGDCLPLLGVPCIIGYVPEVSSGKPQYFFRLMPPAKLWV